MKVYKILLSIKSPLITPLQGDTIFGHLCWGILRNESESSLEKFITQYYENPVLIFSNGFPRGCIPKPYLNPEWGRNSLSISDLNKRKNVKKIKYIPAETLFSNKKLSVENLVDLDLSIMDTISRNRMRNGVDRLTNITVDNSLYNVEERWYPCDMDLYVVTNIDSNNLDRYLEWTFEVGYGAEKSVGYGQLEIVNIEEIEFPTEGNRCMALSNFIPSKADYLEELYADTMTKFGKISGDYMMSSNPFKKPIIMYKEGATFKKLDKEYVGCIMNNIHDNSKIHQHCYAPILCFNEEVSSDG